MLHTEIASLMNEKGKMFEWASKIEYKKQLDTEEKEISTVVDAWAKQIGEKGSDPNMEISNFVVKVVAPEVYDVPDELLDSMFDRGSIGEFDDYQINEDPKNTLIAYDSAKGGNVNKSYIDVTKVAPVWKHKQVETEITYADLRRNGVKTIANLTVFSEEALKNKMFFDIFSQIDAAIGGGEQLINAGGATLTPAALDALALYLIDRGENPMTVSLSKYSQQIAKMAGQVTFMSEQMKNDFNRYGLVNFYNGLRIGHISGAKRTGDNMQLLPDKRVFGIAGKIGTLDMRGQLRVLETFDNNREKVDLKITGFEFGTAINKIDKIAKIVLT
ncbi:MULTISPECIES: hypothetical protein [Paenibacillus]|uniref:Phage major capsid protein n=2 Tax=Paenibacillus TaxID=44249 RepID=A0ABX2ZDB9_PAEPO|nr:MULTISPECIES: hypothetical protein [Paenibacillus]MDR6779349.1 hypothetical protein [Paenibacillus peoriae]ODA08142.1 hypothetical protein A7312_08930 [Paenibacillus polymyxa]